MEKQPFISVVVPTYNRKELLSECIESLLYQSYLEYEILIVDDGSTDGTKKLLEEYSRENPKLRCFTQRNKGSYAARNLGISNSGGEIICFTDDDCIVDENWIKNLVDAYTNDKVGGVGGKVVGHEPTSIAEKYSEQSGILDQGKFNKIVIITANASYRRSVLDEVKGFDTCFRSGGDADMGLRVNMAGYVLEYCPEAVVLHKHRLTLKALIKQQYGYGKGYAKLHKKYTQHFHLNDSLLYGPLVIVYDLVVYPLRFFRMPFVKDKVYYIIKPMIDICMISAFIAGGLTEKFFGEEYIGTKIESPLEFIKKAGIKQNWGK